MKILVLSDSHGAAQAVLAAVEKEQPLDAVFFLGDGERDADDIAALYAGLPLYRVRGNCDFAGYDPEQALVPMGGVLFLLVHGHNHHARSGVRELVRAARAAGADAVLYGHTHVPLLEERGGVTVFNPGSVSRSRSGPNSYGIITVQNGRASYTLHPAGG